MAVDLPLTSSSHFPGKHLQYHDHQLSQGGRPQRHAVVGDLLHIFCVWCSLRICNNLAPDEDQNLPEAVHADAEGRDVQNGHGRPHSVPNYFSNIQHRILGSLSPVESEGNHIEFYENFLVRVLTGGST